jgi:hypothetical protein
MDTEREIVVDLRSTKNAARRLTFEAEFGASESIPGFFSGYVTSVATGNMEAGPVLSWVAFLAALRAWGFDQIRVAGARAREVEQLFARLAPAT